MDTRLYSGASHSPRSLSSLSLSDSSDIGTPETSRSLLFDDSQSLEDTGASGPHVLVVGGLGYIGSHVSLELLKAGYHVVVVDDLSNSYRTVVDRIEKLAAEYCKAENKPLPSINFHEIDYRSPAMRSVLRRYEDSTIHRSKIAGVIHFAAFKSVEESIQKPLAYYKNNVAGLIDFLEILAEFNIYNFVFSSSATVYGKLASQGTPLHEDSMMAVDGVHGLTSPYGRTKYFCEAILDDVARSDPRWTITALRYFNPVGCHESGLLGEDPRQKPTNLFPCITSVITGKRPVLEIFGTDWETPDGTAVRDFIHVVDLARGHIAALAAAAEGKTGASFRTYNLGTGTGHTVREVLQSIEKASARNIPAREVGRRAGDVGFCVAAVDRAQKELGWRTQKSLTDCATDVWNYHVVNSLAPSC
ncbi:hypothetical protein H2199_009011 [Coniosporium tulheliwenetii]|uniref:Uncharacterized protein n=2 Tax=Coniosporium tulheliwenetii TaxID=3383036 RepID=A0ACC2YEP1_9PEZI|nr:hypothetical protein H2199_009216 [Cladosporium sp. JES 115]KAJ9634353.1 hypothetical protein H2199_009011 [Cladosporium sp. JES 115]